MWALELRTVLSDPIIRSWGVTRNANGKTRVETKTSLLSPELEFGLEEPRASFRGYGRRMGLQGCRRTYGSGSRDDGGALGSDTGTSNGGGGSASMKSMSSGGGARASLEASLYLAKVW